MLRDLPPAGASAGRSQTLDAVVRQAQVAAIQNALDQTGGDVPAAATILGRNKHALYRLMKQLDMGRGAG